MSKREKRLQHIRQNPTNVSIDDLEQLMLDYGIEQVRGGKGSHRKYRYFVGGTEKKLSIPAAKPVKRKYIEDVLDAIKEIENDQES